MNIVKQLREKAGMQQKELSLLIGVSQPTVSEWEHQKKDPSGDRLKKLCTIFHVSPFEILCITEPQARTSAKTKEEQELWELREQIRRDPELRILFDLAKSATPEHVRAAVAMLKALKGNSDA